MRGKSFSIALSAVSCALATVFMSLGINIPVLMLTGYVFASVALMLPLAKDFRPGGFLAYVATSLLCLAFGGIAFFYRLFPFIAFFGLHPLVNSLQRKYNVKKWIALPLKAVWFDGVLCATVALLFAFNVEITLPFGWSSAWIYLIVVVLGTLVILPYDWVMTRFQRFADYYVRKFERGKGGQQGGTPASGGENGIDPFETDKPASGGESASSEKGGTSMPDAGGRENEAPSAGEGESTDKDGQDEKK